MRAVTSRSWSPLARMNRNEYVTWWRRARRRVRKLNARSRQPDDRIGAQFRVRRRDRVAATLMIFPPASATRTDFATSGHRVCPERRRSRAGSSRTPASCSPTTTSAPSPFTRRCLPCSWSWPLSPQMLGQLDGDGAHAAEPAWMRTFWPGCTFARSTRACQAVKPTRGWTRPPPWTACSVWPPRRPHGRDEFREGADPVLVRACVDLVADSERVTSAPAATTTPARSLPSTNGTRYGRIALRSPSRVLRSSGLTLAASIRTRTSCSAYPRVWRSPARTVSAPP